MLGERTVCQSSGTLAELKGPSAWYRNCRQALKVRILLADDSAVSRFLVKDFLTRWGYEVLVAEDGEAACRVLDRPDAPSIAIVDWIMPGLDGLQVCRRVREANREPRTYIILLTAKDQQEDIVRGLAAGADDYLKKPFEQQRARGAPGDRPPHARAAVAAPRGPRGVAPAGDHRPAGLRRDPESAGQPRSSGRPPALAAGSTRPPAD